MKKAQIQITATVMILLILAVSSVTLFNWTKNFTEDIQSKNIQNPKIVGKNIQILGLEQKNGILQVVIKSPITGYKEIEQITLNGENCSLPGTNVITSQSISLVPIECPTIKEVNNLVIYTKYNIIESSDPIVISNTYLSCTGPDSSTIAHTAYKTFYASEIVETGQSCLSETRTCKDGILSGSYSAISCVVNNVYYKDLENGENTVLLLSSDKTYDSQEFMNIAEGYSLKSLGLSSAYFDGSGDYLSTSTSTDWNFGTGDFTIDFWINFQTLDTAERIIWIDDSTSVKWGQFAFDYEKPNNAWYLGVGDTLYSFADSNIITNNWYHIALVRNGNNFNLYKDGTLLNTIISPNSITGGIIRIGEFDDSDTFNLGAYLDNLRITKNQALWTSNFNLSDLNYTVDSNTKLLLKFDEGEGVTTFSDLSPSTHTITRTGNVVEKQNVIVSGDVKHINFNEAKIGTGAGYFDGAGDLLNTGLSVDDLKHNINGNGPITFEFWFYPTDGFTTEQILFSGFNSNPEVNRWDLEFNAFGNKEINWIEHDSATYINSNTLIEINKWHHVVVIHDYDNTKLTIFIDGVKDVEKTISRTLASHVNLGIGGRVLTSSGSFKGYIDEFRVSNVSYRYTTDFIPQSTPFEPDSHTKLLLHFDNVENNNFIDSSFSSNSITKIGNSVQKGIPFNSDLAGYFDGSTGSLTIPDSSDWDFGTGDFTIDFWGYHKDDTAYRGVFTFGTDWYWFFGGSLHFYGDIGNQYVGYTPTLNKWIHYAVVRESGVLKFYVNGIQIHSVSAPANIDGTNTLIIGRQTFNPTAQYWNGYMDEVRISKGIARWTNNFNPPTQPYETDSYTKLLLHFDGENGWTNFTDSSGQNHSISYTGTTSVSRIYPINYSAIFFDGTSDYLDLSILEDWNVGTKDFTIDFWMSLSSINSATTHYSNMVIGLLESDLYGLVFGFPQGGTTAKLYYNDLNNIDIGTINTNQWNHIAITRNNETIKIYKNGILKNSVTANYNYTFSKGFNIGRVSSDYSGSSYPTFNGYLDNIRITKGEALWTSNFIPPNSTSNLVQVTYNWEIEEWSNCLNEIQTRTVTCKNNLDEIGDESLCTEAKPAISQSCNESIILTGDTQGAVGTTGTFEDLRDGNVYTWRKFSDNKIWMTQNLKFNLTCKDNTWINNVDNGWCGPGPDSTQLYQRSTILNGESIEPIKGICPNGWHISNKSEIEAFWNAGNRPTSTDFETGACTKIRHTGGGYTGCGTGWWSSTLDFGNSYLMFREGNGAWGTNIGTTFNFEVGDADTIVWSNNETGAARVRCILD